MSYYYELLLDDELLLDFAMTLGCPWYDICLLL